MPVGETAKKKSFEILEELRKNDIKILFSFGKDSVRSQMKFADKIKTKYILLLGQEEVNRNEIILQEASSELQENIPLPKLIKVLKNKLNNA
jgi:histidyl-tRNA synthetase